MKRNRFPFQYVLVISMAFTTLSCNLTPEMEKPDPAPAEDRSVGSFGGPVFPTFMTLDRVRIFTSGSNIVTGTVTVEIATTDGVVLESAVLPGSSMTGPGKWRTFYLDPVTLIAGTKYRLQVKRSDQPDYTNNFMHWGATDGAIDAYPKGETSISGTHPPYDMAFITYSGGYVDQQQTTYRYFWGINQQRSWQEFVPEKIWVIHP